MLEPLEKARIGSQRHHGATYLLYSSVASRKAKMPGISATTKATYTWVSDMDIVGLLLISGFIFEQFRVNWLFSNNLVTRCNTQAPQCNP